MSKVYIVSFATEEFEFLRKQMELSAKKFNLNNFHSYNKLDITSTEFFRKNREIFSYKRGFGLWLWKPYIIQQSIQRANNGDVIFYVDSGCEFINNPCKLINIAKKNRSGIVAFNCFPIVNKKFVKKATFINLNCNEDVYWNSIHTIATVILFRKSPETILFINEWLKECENISSLSPEKSGDTNENFDEFIEHREDQSILSLLIKKNQVETYRNPSKWGNFLKLPQYRVLNEYVGSPYAIDDSIKEYAKTPLLNSPYPTIFEFNRKQNQNKESIIKELYERFIKKGIQIAKTKFQK